MKSSTLSIINSVLLVITITLNVIIAAKLLQRYLAPQKNITINEIIHDTVYCQRAVITRGKDIFLKKKKIKPIIRNNSAITNKPSSATIPKTPELTAEDSSNIDVIKMLIMLVGVGSIQNDLIYTSVRWYKEFRLAGATSDDSLTRTVNRIDAILKEVILPADKTTELHKVMPDSSYFLPQ